MDLSIRLKKKISKPATDQTHQSVTSFLKSRKYQHPKTSTSPRPFTKNSVNQKIISGNSQKLSMSTNPIKPIRNPPSADPLQNPIALEEIFSSRWLAYTPAAALLAFSTLYPKTFLPKPILEYEEEWEPENFHSRYSGDLSGGTKHGSGVLTSTFKLQFKDYHYTYFQGNFMSDCIHQRDATITKRWNHTNVTTSFKGDIILGRRNGSGQLTDSLGNILEAYWKNDYFLRNNLKVIVKDKILWEGGGLNRFGLLDGDFIVKGFHEDKSDRLKLVVSYESGKVVSFVRYSGNGKACEWCCKKFLKEKSVKKFEIVKSDSGEILSVGEKFNSTKKTKVERIFGEKEVIRWIQNFKGIDVEYS